ncbi:AmmeMemoRadiSam system protein B [Candidatus Poribacteria bacterium]|nr:AmmeMemoRadiSam system protein B [Candidatus Poribacteria bacterium]
MVRLFSGEGKNETRTPAVANMFYPGSPDELKSMIQKFMENTHKIPVDEKPIGLIVPHAGYVYSGQIAATAYKQIEGMNFDTVIMLGVSHRSGINGASVYKSGTYETPLGSVEIDRDLASIMMDKSDMFTFQPKAHAAEHSLEVQVPFLQSVIKNFKILPILMGYWSEVVCSHVSESIIDSIGEKNILIVASTDMSHYYPYDTARRMDNVALSSIKNMDTRKLMADLGAKRCELCGAAPVITTLMTAKKMGAEKLEILQYANSGDVTGDKTDGVVGYFAAAIYK